MTVQPQKRRGPAPTGKGVPVQVRCQPSLLASVDNWVSTLPDPKPTRPEAIRRLAEIGLKHVPRTIFVQVTKA